MGKASNLLDFLMKGSDYFDAPRIGGGRAKDPALYTPFSAVKHTKTAPSQYQVRGRIGEGLLPPSVIEPESLLGKNMYFATGDRTSNQRMIDEINEYILQDSPMTYGGPEYMDQVGRGVWASEANPMKAKANAFRNASQRGEDILLSYMPMSERSGDFSKHMSDIYGSMIRSGGNRGGWRDNVSKIDAAIAERFPKLKTQVSISSPDFPAWLSSQKGGARASLIKFFDSNQMQGLGMPDVAAARFAVTNPDLMLSDTASIGYRIGTPKPEGMPIRSNEHPSYNTFVERAEGTGSSTLGFDVPYIIGARDSALPKAASTGKLEAMPKDVKSYMGNPNINQFIDQQWVDEVSTYRNLLQSQGKARADEYTRNLLDAFIDR